MRQQFNQQSTDKQRILGAIKGVQQEIAKLAPHPDRPGDKGPCLVKSKTGPASNDEREAMLGSLLVECVMGSFLGESLTEAFGGVNTPSSAQSLSVNDIVEVVDEYWMDRRDERADYAIGNKKTLGPTFNVFGDRELSMKAYTKDLPARKKLEATYTSLTKKLENTTKSEFARNNAYKLAA